MVNKAVLALAFCLLWGFVASADSFPFFFVADPSSPASPRHQMQAAKPSSALELFTSKLAFSDASTPFGSDSGRGKDSARAASALGSSSAAQDEAVASTGASDDFLRETRATSESRVGDEFFAFGGRFSDLESTFHSGELGSAQNSAGFGSGIFFPMDSGAPNRGSDNAHQGSGNGNGNGNGSGKGNGVGNGGNNGNGGNGPGSANPEIVSTPEPSSLLLLAFGFPIFFLFYQSRSARKLTGFTAN